MRIKIGQVVVSGLAALSLMGVAVPAGAVELLQVRQTAEPSAEARTLAARVIALTTPNMEKQMLDYMTSALAQSGIGNADAQLGAWMEKNAGPIFMVHLRAFVGEIETVYATRFTVAELQAMVDFYESPIGREIAAKQIQVGIDVGERQGPLMSAYVTDLIGQMCAANDCGETKGGSPATRKPAGR